MLVKQKFIFSRVFVVIILLNYAFGLLRHAVCITSPPPPYIRSSCLINYDQLLKKNEG